MVNDNDKCGNPKYGHKIIVSEYRGYLIRRRNSETFDITVVGSDEVLHTADNVYDADTVIDAWLDAR